MFMPKLTETILEILSEAPYNGKSTLGEGSAAINFRPEMLLTTMLAFTLKVLGGRLIQKRNVTLEGPTGGVASGKDFDITVKAERLPFVKDIH